MSLCVLGLGFIRCYRSAGHCSKYVFFLFLKQNPLPVTQCILEYLIPERGLTRSGRSLRKTKKLHPRLISEAPLSLQKLHPNYIAINHDLLVSIVKERWKQFMDVSSYTIMIYFGYQSATRNHVEYPVEIQDGDTLQQRELVFTKATCQRFLTMDYR